MDAIMAERVNKLARSLKDLHLAATMDEAYKRAEEILLGSAPHLSEEKTLNELMAENARSQQKMPDQTAPVEEIIIESKPAEAAAQDTPVENQENKTQQ